MTCHCPWSSWTSSCAQHLPEKAKERDEVGPATHERRFKGMDNRAQPSFTHAIHIGVKRSTHHAANGDRKYLYSKLWSAPASRERAYLCYAVAGLHPESQLSPEYL